MHDDGPIRIFIGSDVYQQRAGAEEALEYTIRKHASLPLEICFMRAGDNMPVSNGPKLGHWNLCRAPGQAWPKHGHGTDFSVFRCAVPELAGFTGKAIYLDVDMLLMADITDLWWLPQRAPYLCNTGGRTEVALIRCEPFRDAKWWPRIAMMQTSGVYLHQYRKLLAKAGFLDTSLSWKWNCVDEWQDDAKLIHYSSVPTQPWHPYPSVTYQPHPHPKLTKLFFDTLEEARAAAR